MGNMKYCKVIVVAYHLNRIERTNEKFPHHDQQPLSHDEQIGLWQKILDIETTVDGGMGFDTVIVCNGESAHDWWKHFDGTKTKNGNLIILGRPNDGGSFGGYNHAFRNTTYDNFIFTEDDILIYGDRYYARILESYKANPNAGYLCLVGISKHKKFRHCHGGVGFSTRERLSEVTDTEGNLPHPQKGGWDQKLAVKYGEYRLTGDMRRLGRELITIDGYKQEWTVDNCCLPYWGILK